jgi:hypothetical protein
VPKIGFERGIQAALTELGEHGSIDEVDLFHSDGYNLYAERL